MFNSGFEKVAFIGGAVKAVKNVFGGNRMSSAIGQAAKNAPATTQNAVKAIRNDGSKVMSDWGVKQGLKSGTVRYANIT